MSFFVRCRITHVLNNSQASQGCRRQFVGERKGTKKRFSALPPKKKCIPALSKNDNILKSSMENFCPYFSIFFSISVFWGFGQASRGVKYRILYPLPFELNVAYAFETYKALIPSSLRLLSTTNWQLMSRVSLWQISYYIHLAKMLLLPPKY